ncbi:MAG: acetyltransferase [Tepidisphaeraceae bacterium]|jgi:UDP-perosamine 4-acetyltransferase
MDVIIIGAGGHGRVVLDILRAAGGPKPIGFIDADPQLAGKTIGGLCVLGQANLLPKLRTQKVKAAIVAVGDNRARRSYAKKLLEQGFELINAIHPSSVVSPTARLGKNVVVAAGAVIGTDCLIADDVIINTSAVIDHECEIGQAVHICPAAALAGRVRVGEEAFIGLGCRVIQCLTIGSQAVVGAGAVVIADVPEGATVVGVPARVIKVQSDNLAHAGA